MMRIHVSQMGAGQGTSSLRPFTCQAQYRPSLCQLLGNQPAAAAPSAEQIATMKIALLKVNKRHKIYIFFVYFLQQNMFSKKI